MSFDDEFSGTAVDLKKWNPMDGWTMNNVQNRAANLSVADGVLSLTLSSSTSGAGISTDGDASGQDQYLVDVGDYVEARVDFPGDGSHYYNWPAFWISGANWPSAGENDIAEVLDGDLTVNYHDDSGAHNQGAPDVGFLGNSFHTYGLLRKASSVDVYWDGVLVRSYPTNDNGVGECILLNNGRSSSYPMYGASVKVDWVRAYKPS